MLLNSTQHHCIFIKNTNHNYCYANENYLQLMGVTNHQHLYRSTDMDLSKNKRDAKTYWELDDYILDEGRSLSVSETVSPQHNQPIVKTMTGHLYPLFAQSDRSNFVLGVVTPESKLLKLDFDCMFKLTVQELDELLVKRSYPIKLSLGTVSLSKLEIKILIQLLKGGHAGEIALALMIKQTTVESYLVNIKNKLAVQHKSELIHLMLREQLLEQIVL